MAQEQTAKENGHKILEIYKHFDCKEGDVLSSNNFLAVGMNKNWDTRELQLGLNFAVETGWLERAPNGWLKLTKAGYREM